MPDRIPIDGDHPDPSLLEKATRIMQEGGVIAYPTETFYGLGADPLNESALRRLYLIKGRTFSKPIPLIIGQRSDAERYVRTISDEGRRLMDHFWPGPLTILFPAASLLPGVLTANTGKIGIRLSPNPIPAELARRLGGAITATSANISNEKECSTAGDVIRSLGVLVDAVVDGGASPGGRGSTIVDITVAPAVILREGVISAARIGEVVPLGTTATRGN
ncbi:MAG: threonylcarbamoyl-AMP synthase [Deltaproteobacteria bacterium]|nr:threonylcarbamoyl-AMP synthase [Deltaproteobacteria bacterium]